MARTKGVTLIGLVISLRRRREEALRVLPEEYHDVLDQRIGRREWYPFRLFMALLRAVLALSKRPAEDLLEEMGRSLAHTQRSVYSDLFEIAEPELRAGAFWPTFHDTGVFELKTQAPEMTLFELRDRDEMEWEFCAILGANLAELHRMQGARNVSIEHERCISRGDETCIWRCRWSR